LFHPTGKKGKADFLENLVYFLKNPKNAKKMGKEGQECIKNYFIDARFYKELGSVIQSLAFK
jgi:hypothetical protein